MRDEALMRVWKVANSIVITVPKEFRDQVDWIEQGKYVWMRLDKRRNRIVIEPVR